jgi:uncharacterized protein (TIGR02145 family)
MKKIAVLCLFLGFSIALLAQDGEGFTDSRDNRNYKTLLVGTKTWMAENLKFETDKSACYKKKAENCEKYGRLYGRTEAQKVCPEGWHLPSKEEVELFMTASTGQSNFFTYSGITSAPLYLFNNTFGFNILYGGYSTMTGKFEEEKKEVYYWTSTEIGPNDYAQFSIDKENFRVLASQFKVAYGANVRCIKD